jgi:hypothetical protein
MTAGQRAMGLLLSTVLVVLAAFRPGLSHVSLT